MYTSKESRKALRANIRRETRKNKLYAIGLVAIGLAPVFLLNDLTALFVLSFFAVPLFFAKENWIMES